MSAYRRWHRSTVGIAVVAALALPAVLPAQRTAGEAATAMDSLRPSRWSQPVVSIRYGSYRLSANSAFFRLIDQALDPGSDALRPRVWSADVGIPVTARLRFQFGVEHGSRTVGSRSRAVAINGSSVGQETMLSLSSVYLAGAQWRLARWSSPAAGRDRARLYVHGGAGLSSYRIRQSGEFIDANRRVTFGQEFASSGVGSALYLGAAVELPVQSWLAITGDWRLQRGSAAMTDDFASFDRLDLGGARASLGMAIFPRGYRRQ